MVARSLDDSGRGCRWPKLFDVIDRRDDASASDHPVASDELEIEDGRIEPVFMPAGRMTHRKLAHAPDFVLELSIWTKVALAALKGDRTLAQLVEHDARHMPGYDLVESHLTGGPYLLETISASKSTRPTGVTSNMCSAPPSTCVRNGVCPAGQAHSIVHLRTRAVPLASLAIASAADCCLPGTFAASDESSVVAHQPECSRLFCPPCFHDHYEAGAQPGGVLARGSASTSAHQHSLVGSCELMVVLRRPRKSAASLPSKSQFPIDLHQLG